MPSTTSRQPKVRRPRQLPAPLGLALVALRGWNSVFMYVERRTHYYAEPGRAADVLAVPGRGSPHDLTRDGGEDAVF
jgi:hypothetical protein